MRLRFRFLVAWTLVGALSLHGQKEFEKADKLYSLKAFDLAIENYTSALQKYPTHANGYAKLAQAYSMKNDLLSAIETYEKALSLGVELEYSYQLQYAQTLKKVGLYDKAAAIYQEYAQVNEQDASYHLAGIESAKILLQQPDAYDVQLFAGNTKESDFGISFFKNKKVYCSFRTDIKRENDKKNVSYIQTTGSQLFALEGGKATFLRPDTKENFYIGPVSYSRDGRMVAFMRNTFSNGCTKIFSEESDMSIYIAMTDENGDFSDPSPFPFNELSYAYGFPSLSTSDNAIYFASNRAGGFGGFDLYVSNFKDGEWSSPINLGANVNSAGNEVSPFIVDNQLYFSSDMLMGLGGYDIFSSTLKDGEWQLPSNMGKGINSPSDDYYFAIDPTDNAYYFTSNRLGGRGNDDIYMAYPLKRLKKDMLVIAESTMPKAVRLDDIAQVTPQTKPMELQILSDEATPAVVTVSAVDEVTIPAVMEEDLFEGAVLKSVTMGREETWDETTTFYFVQLAAYAQSNGSLNNFSGVKELGNLFRFYKSANVKIRLGKYTTRGEAEKVLQQVRSRGFKDAFVTMDVLAHDTYEILDNSKTGSDWINDYNPATAFKVKLASYTNPLNFDIDNAIDLGRLEQWTKGQFTIFILGGFESFEAAEQARVKAKQRGFVDAELVQDDNGIIKKVSSK